MKLKHNKYVLEGCLKDLQVLWKCLEVLGCFIKDLLIFRWRSLGVPGSQASFCTKSALATRNLCRG